MFQFRIVDVKISLPVLTRNYLSVTLTPPILLHSSFLVGAAQNKSVFVQITPCCYLAILKSFA